MALNQVHQVLQVALAGRTRTCTGSQQVTPSRRYGRSTANSRRSCSGFPGRSVKNRATGLRRLELVSRRPADEISPSARLIDGARRGPLEDSGGFRGYEEIMDALADPSHPDHAEHSGWVAT